MKKIVVLLFSLIILVSGCSIRSLSDSSINSNIDKILSDNSKLYNVNFEGYKYYVPRGLKFLKKNEYNALLEDKNNNKYYFYVDVISYYHKTKLKYKVDKKAYYSRKLNYNKKKGYIEINKVGKKYFVECVFNYSKVEVLVSKKDLVTAVNNLCYLVKSVKYNDKVLDSLVGENVLSYKEEDYNIFNSKSDDGDFLDYVKEYDNKGKKPSDEETIDVNSYDD